jgi:hypothetical protein
MKKIIYSKAAAALVAVLLLSSCKDLLNSPDINKNPNAPADAPVDVLLSGVEVGVAVAHEDTDTRIATYWSGTMAGQSRQQAGYQAYIVSSTTFDNSWYLIYHPIGNARLVQAKSAPFNNKVAVGIAQVLEALQMVKITSLYGDVPYSQALDVDKYPKPVFDKQTDIYAALITLLNSAYANLITGTGGVTSAGDFLYGGDAAKWAKAAKTLQARLYMHVKDYPNAILAAQAGISGTSGDMLVPHGGAQTIDLNLNFDMFENSRPGDCGFDDAYLPKFMQAIVAGTPTYKRNAKTSDKALYNHNFKVGVYTSGLDPNTVDGAYQGDSFHPLVTYYENQLILAEALARVGTNLTGAMDAINTVRADLTKNLGAATPSASLYGNPVASKYIATAGVNNGNMQYDPYVLTDFAAAGIADTQGGSQQKNLIYEALAMKYTLNNLQYESFNDLRRTQIATPVVKLPIPFNIPTATQYPARFIYSQNEINTNPNVPKTGTGGVADIYQKLPIFQ